MQNAIFFSGTEMLGMGIRILHLHCKFQMQNVSGTDIAKLSNFAFALQICKMQLPIVCGTENWANLQICTQICKFAFSGIGPSSIAQLFDWVYSNRENRLIQYSLKWMGAQNCGSHSECSKILISRLRNSKNIIHPSDRPSQI